MKKTSLVLGLFVAIVVLGVLTQLVMVRAPVERETFAQKEIGAPSTGTSMGPYDSASAIPGASGWLMTEESGAPVGTSPVAASGEPRLMFLAEPRTSPACCPSAYNTDTGCVCLGDQDLKIMSSRGGNRAGSA
jgi:hypothetical protein